MQGQSLEHEKIAAGVAAAFENEETPVNPVSTGPSKEGAQVRVETVQDVQPTVEHTVTDAGAIDQAKAVLETVSAPVVNATQEIKDRVSPEPSVYMARAAELVAKANSVKLAELTETLEVLRAEYFDNIASKSEQSHHEQEPLTPSESIT